MGELEQKEQAVTARIIDGEAVAEEIKQNIAHDVQAFADQGKDLKLVALQVGENPASKVYTNMQRKQSEAVGIVYELLNLPETSREEEVIRTLRALNADEGVTGIILQTPLPSHINPRLVQTWLSPAKDVEGMHPQNMGKLFHGGGIVATCCTPMAAMELLKRTCPDIAGKEVVIVGHSEIVGKPLAAMLLWSVNASPTVTICHVATKALATHTCRADVLIVATGVAQARWMGYRRRKKAGETPPLPDLSPLIKAEMVKEGAIIIDVAINRIPKGFDADGEPVKNEKGKPAMQTVGDVEYDRCLPKVSAITPVPGGVGPVTVAMLLRNTVACAKAQAGQHPETSLGT